MSKCLGLVAALLSLSALISVTNAAEILPSVEVAETARLNRDIAKNNDDADQRYARLRDQYLQQKRKNDLLHEQYLAQMKEYDSRNAKYQEEKRKNDLLQEQFRKGGSSN